MKNHEWCQKQLRVENPCQRCARIWKKPGCHDTCPDRKPWVEELERVNKARREYDRTHYNKYQR